MTLVLNFHGIGKPIRPYEAGEEPVWISQERFLELLDFVKAHEQLFQITFDDGNDSDFAIAVPELRHRNLAASFFVAAARLDQTGFLTSQQVQEIDADPLFTIGSHGMDHRPWPSLAEAELEHEIATSQDLLEQLCNHPICDAGLPFGRYDRRILKKLAACGYQTIYSSDGGPRLASGNPIPRLSVRWNTSVDDLAASIAKLGIARRLANEAKVRIRALK